MPVSPTAVALASRAILIVGAPRSGTTWLAKIFDSHPDVLYRHEPDEAVRPGPSMRDSMALWARQTDPRTAGKHPFFAKSWQPAAARWLRTGLAFAAAAAGRAHLPVWRIPDLGATSRSRLVVKSVRLHRGIGAFAAACPEAKAVLILRHPCGQIASVVRGTEAGRFGLAEEGTDMPFDEASTVAFATRFGLDDPTFQGLPDAAKYAWAWREFNETALDGIAGRSNAEIVIYEDLCAQPMEVARRLLMSAGLAWNEQTETFLRHSTAHDGEAGYYAIVRNSLAAAGRWKTTMPRPDQDAVRAVVRASPLAHYWPDLAPP